MFHFVNVSVSHVLFPGRLSSSSLLVCFVLFTACRLFVLRGLPLLLLALCACLRVVCVGVSVCHMQDARQSELPPLNYQFHQIFHQDFRRFMSDSVVTSLTYLSTLRATADCSPKCIGTGFWIASDWKSGAGVGSNGDGTRWAIKARYFKERRLRCRSDPFYCVTVPYVTDT